MTEYDILRGDSDLYQLAFQECVSNNWFYRFSPELNKKIPNPKRTDIAFPDFARLCEVMEWNPLLRCFMYKNG